MTLLTILLSACVTTACNPLYSVEQSNVERGYRWVSRGNYTQAISTFQHNLREYPNSGLGHLGLADSFTAVGQELDAVEMYNKALPLLRAEGHATPENAIGSAQRIGEKVLSYQNQGLRFPHGVEAYARFRRGVAYEALAKKYPGRANEYTIAAGEDYTAAQSLAPDWPDPKRRLDCLAGPKRPACKD